MIVEKLLFFCIWINVMRNCKDDYIYILNMVSQLYQFILNYRLIGNLTWDITYLRLSYKDKSLQSH